MRETFRTHFPLAILAGICIAIGGTVNLRVGGVAGAVLFAFGLTTVVYYGLKLYTGTAGFIRRHGDWGMLIIVLLGNIVGCLLSALMIRYAQPDCVEKAGAILASRLDKGAFFILCGFAHSIADAFYFLTAPWEQLAQPMVLVVYIAEVLGNFVGCNLYRWIAPQDVRI